MILKQSLVIICSSKQLQKKGAVPFFLVSKEGCRMVDKISLSRNIFSSRSQQACKAGNIMVEQSAYYIVKKSHAGARQKNELVGHMESRVPATQGYIVLCQLVPTSEPSSAYTRRQLPCVARAIACDIVDISAGDHGSFLTSLIFCLNCRFKGLRLLQ